MKTVLNEQLGKLNEGAVIFFLLGSMLLVQH